MGFCDLTGGSGLLGQVEGRNAASVNEWFDQQSAAWRAGVEVVAIDMCTVFKAAVTNDTSKRFTFLLTEQAVRWPLLPAPAMAMQVDRLASISRLPSVNLGIIPLAGHIPAMPLNVFTLYDRSIATVETSTGVMVFKDARDITSYSEEFSAYEQYALWDEAARSRLGEWAELFR